ncbi:MAG: nucleotidyl transferase AbiEii/AbiGii toxin family protein [Candidatus Diapherotrites archaeon]|nr:nucleotidyl transferase AbiEii/AbiGii toxin family protein [Candidatus Diapherotrites archaeon]
MIDKKTLMNYQNILGFNLGQVERDYLQHLILQLLYKRVSNQLVFKGGTCLQKTLGLNRFSEDLDFTLNSELNLDKVLGEVINDVERFGYPASLRNKKMQESGISFRLAINGPLYDGSERTKAVITLQISTREEVLLKPKSVSVVPVYPDLMPYITIVMQPKEILAEKMRAIATRKKARDLYDTWFLLRKKTKLDKKLVQKKLDYYSINYDSNTIHHRIIELKETWGNELASLMQDIPDYQKVATTVIKEIS